MKTLHSKRQLAALFMPGFILGIVYVNFLVKKYPSNPEIFGDRFFSVYQNTEIIAGEFIFYLIRVRIIPFLLLLSLVFTHVRKISAALYTAWTGFSCGMMLTVAVLEKGILGCIFCLAAIFPQFLCYVPAYFIVIWYGYTFPKNRWNIQKTIFVLISMIAGILLELYVNPVILKTFLHMI